MAGVGCFRVDPQAGVAEGERDTGCECGIGAELVVLSLSVLFASVVVLRDARMWGWGGRCICSRSLFRDTGLVVRGGRRS